MNKKHLLAVTDIFGRTTALDNLINKIAGKFARVNILDPYGGAKKDFENEDQAYAAFQEHMGLTGYIRKVKQMLGGRQHLPQVILGFSVGASAVWAVSSNLGAFKNTRAICFYSSQIRNFLDITPEIETDLYFAARENAYDVNEVIARLSATPNVNCLKTEFLHGFMNEKSVNFNKQGYARYIDIF